MGKYYLSPDNIIKSLIEVGSSDKVLEFFEGVIPDIEAEFASGKEDAIELFEALPDDIKGDINLALAGVANLAENLATNNTQTNTEEPAIVIPSVPGIIGVVNTGIGTIFDDLFGF